MWILIECDDIANGPGHDENKRYVLSDNLSIVTQSLGKTHIIAMGNEVHPCTPGDEGYHCPICHKDIKTRVNDD